MEVKGEEDEGKTGLQIRGRDNDGKNKTKENDEKKLRCILKGEEWK